MQIQLGQPHHPPDEPHPAIQSIQILVVEQQNLEPGSLEGSRNWPGEAVVARVEGRQLGHGAQVGREGARGAHVVHAQQGERGW